MSRNMKILVVVLALGALVSGRYLFALVSQSGAASQEAATALQLKSSYDDTDHDGLTARDEEYWRTDPNKADTDGDGFMDGEEVASGHNPLIKGPDDWLDPGKNLTTRTIQLALGGVLSGDLATSSATYEQSIQNLADAMAGQYQKNVAIDQDQLTLVEPTLENKTRYVKSIGDALLNIFLPAQQETNAFLYTLKDISMSDPLVLTKDAKRYTAFTAQARRMAATMGDRAQRFAAIPTPKTFLIQQRAGVQWLRLLQSNLLLAATLKEDALQGSLAIRMLVKLDTETAVQFLYDLTQAMQTKLNE